MAKKLREGLIEPSSIDPKELPEYMADTYRGYMKMIKDRMSVLNANMNINFGFSEINREFFALQIRMIFELIAFAVTTFHQRQMPLAKSKRTINNALEALKLIKNHTWLTSIDPHFEINDFNSVIDFPKIVTRFSNKETFKEIHGRLGDLLHEQQRPRPSSDHKLSIEDLHNLIKDIYVMLNQHIIEDKNGTGWYINMNVPSQPEGIMIMKLCRESNHT